MRIFKYLAACAGIAMLFIGVATSVQAQEPNYIRALSDLRTARDYIQFDHRPGFQGQRDIAISEINKAMDDIKRAAWDDGRSTRFVPPSGMFDAAFPMHQALKALEAASHNTEHAVDGPQNSGLRERALQHISVAARSVNNIIAGRTQ